MQDVFKKIIEKLNAEMKKAEKDVLGGSGILIKEPYTPYKKAIEIVEQAESEYNGGWIPCSERLPDDYDNRFYMCIVENHEEDLPMFCQYEEEYGFGFWNDIYDKYSLGFVDTEFETIEESGYEKVIAWQQMPELYHQRGE